MPPLALKVIWFILSLSGLISCWTVLGTLAHAERSYWAPVVYCMGCTIVEGIFCIGMVWHMDPSSMPPIFCAVQTLLTGFGYFLVTGISSVFAFHTVFKPASIKRYAIPWRPLYIIPVIIFPTCAFLAQVLAVLVFDAAQPEDDLQCDATNPLWVRFLGYAGTPLAFYLLFFFTCLLWHTWLPWTYTDNPANNQTHLTSLPKRKARFGFRKTPHPHSLPRTPTRILPSPSPSTNANLRTEPARVPISPGFESPVLSARQFHLPFSPPLSPDASTSSPVDAGTSDSFPWTKQIHRHANNDDHYEFDTSHTATRSYRHHHDNNIKGRSQHDLSTSRSSTLEGHRPSDFDEEDDVSIPDSTVSSSFPRFAAPHITPGATPNPSESPVPHDSHDFLRYLNEYKENERQSGDTYRKSDDIEKVVRGQGHTRNSTLDWDDLSSLRWNRGANGGEYDNDEYQKDGYDVVEAIRGKMHGSRHTRAYNHYYGPGKRATTEESYDATTEEATGRHDSHELRASPRTTPIANRPTQSSIIWRIIKVQLPITLVLLLSTLSTLIDIIRQRSTPTESENIRPPTPFGTQHVALLLLAWGPVFAFFPLVRRRLMFWRKTQWVTS
ncbi:hypothetical protein Moror_10567 [Moniliophthora roreri MCA 2997]|uniref:Uncharacterized protein n=1 Tax=Moniliophthora roreri (strain MCA 2997) TaxID=1381753 RepID=V2WY13_MONRO|nr:hypothetical protein Moror_10567 [Moniliophthora roreri MCA 2997]